MKYHVNEIFASLQGEGFNTGRPVVFVRLAHCNLACNWCDTDYEQYAEMELQDILDTVSLFSMDSVILTGGEPTIHEGFAELAAALKKAGYWLALETNGIIGLPEEVAGYFDYVVASPKAVYSYLYEKASILRKADEVRIVVDGDIMDFCRFIEQRIEARWYYLSPKAGIDESFNVLQSIELLGMLNNRSAGKKWLLSFQTHKMAQIQ